jgi:glycosyltransferase involved in cell wall biosynthesis
LFHYGLPQTKGKGLRRLLEALKLVREAKLPAVLHLGGDYATGLRETEDLLGMITEFALQGAVVRLGHLPRESLEQEAQRCLLGVFPFDEGYSSKRSSVAALTQLELPLIVGAGSKEEHPFYRPSEASAAALAVQIVDLLSGRLEREWAAQVASQREYGRRFSFSNIAQSHLQLYERLLKADVKATWRS